MATITVNVETPDEAGVVGATIVIGNPITNTIGNGVRLEFDNSGIADKTTDSNGQATWTVPDDYVGTWLVHILDSDGNRMILPYKSPRFYSRSISYHAHYLLPTGTDRIEGVITIGAEVESATYPFLLEVA
jgi:hypothetical protein